MKGTARGGRERQREVAGKFARGRVVTAVCLVLSLFVQLVILFYGIP